MPTSATPIDHLARRRNAVQGARAELNDKLAAIADAFDTAWLTATPASSPVQRLWQRSDELATNELLNFGDAVERWAAQDQRWLAGQVKAIKGRDRGNADGAIFEILGLNLFKGTVRRVLLAPASKPGFDGTLELADGSRVLVSLKNHGLSTYEKSFLASARRFDQAVQLMMAGQRPEGAHVRILFDALPDAAAWNAAKDETAQVLARGGAGIELGPAGRPIHIAVHPIEQKFRPLSTSQLSRVCQVFAPQHRNEQDKFLDDIRKGCANLLRHTAHETSPDVCRMIVLRLSATASIGKCVEWANWYFEENGEDGLAVILLYQSAVVKDAMGNSTIAHYLRPTTGPAFEMWRRLGTVERSLPQIEIMVGTTTTEPPRSELSDGVIAVDLSGYYSYQRGEIFKTHDPTFSSGMISMGSPAVGISMHLVLETQGQSSRTLSVIDFPDRTLELLP